MGEVEEEFLPLKEAAVYVGISRTTLWNMAREGRIQAYSKPTDKRVKLFRRSDLEALKHPRPLEDQDTQEAARVGRPPQLPGVVSARSAGFIVAQGVKMPEHRGHHEGTYVKRPSGRWQAQF